MVVPGANGACGKRGSIGAEPPPSAAGFVQSVSERAGARPNRASGGTGPLNAEKAMTQPSWRSERHALRS